MNNLKWGNFVIEDLFHVKRGKRLIKKDRKYGKIPYYSATDSNNGLTDFISNPLFVEKNKIIVTTFGDAFFIEGEFTASDEITILENNKVNRHNGLFVCGMIKNNIEKFKFGYKCFSGRIKRQTVLLPLDEKNNSPDWVFMESYIKEKEKSLHEKYKSYLEKKQTQTNTNKDKWDVNQIYSKKWSEFFISDIGEIGSGKDIYGAERIKGDTPYISAKSKDNGIGHFIGNENKTLESNCISVNRNGSVGYAFYHPYKALYSNDCRKIRLNKNKHVSLFIANQITSQRGKYGYGYKMGTGRLKRQKIMLPIDDNDNPDWDFMEAYMKQLEYKKISKYLDYIEDRIN